MEAFEALGLLDKVLSEVNTTRVGHDKIKEAVKVISLQLNEYGNRKSNLE